MQYQGAPGAPPSWTRSGTTHGPEDLGASLPADEAHRLHLPCLGGATTVGYGEGRRVMWFSHDVYICIMVMIRVI